MLPFSLLGSDTTLVWLAVCQAEQQPTPENTGLPAATRQGKQKPTLKAQFSASVFDEKLLWVQGTKNVVV